MNNQRSYWESELYNQKYDLIVIGAGLTGQSTAYFFKKKYPDARVLILDRGFFPIGASTRNAGFACIGTIGEHIADLEIDSEEQLKERIKARYEGLLLLRETLGDEVIDYEESGGWEIFPDAKEFLKVRDQIGKFNSWLEELTGEKEVYEAGTYLGIPSIYNKTEGMLHPGKMIQRLFELNRDIGIEFRWNTPINKLEPESCSAFVENGPAFTADRMVVATNAFTNQLFPQVKINPGRGYVFVTNEIDLMEWKGTFHFNKGYVYFRNLGEQRILLGGGRNIDSESEETSEFGVNTSIKEYLINFANEIMELPDYWKIEQEWSGIMGFTESKSPIFEKIDENCLVVAGLSGMGVALGMRLGKKAAHQI